MGWLRSEGAKFPMQNLIRVDLTHLGTEGNYEMPHRLQNLSPHRHSTAGPADNEAESFTTLVPNLGNEVA